MSKTLSPSDVSYIKGQVKAGKTYEQVASELVEQGYVTPRGGPLTRQTINNLITKHSQVGPSTKVKYAVRAKAQASTLMQDIATVANNQLLSPALQEKLIKLLVSHG